ncbi:MAG: 50S ribosomal protein L11 methyltransferase [Desulfamplus sp.]|nr:50S ribosomal protein L11 methyltransferase [Desulfamplus sp.]
MKWIHVKALFESKDISLAEELVSDIFFSMGLKGVVCQVPLEAPPEGFGSDALPIPDETWVSGYIPDTDSSLEILENIRKKAGGLAVLDIKVSIETGIVDQEDWAESWKQFFHVSRITDRMVIKPAWRDFVPNPDDVVIEIDPGMAFGTGTHPTTSMCMALIEKYLEAGNSFFDVGTGSGILMITAAKLGASSLAGIDTDEVAVQVAKDNLVKNNIPADLFYVEKGTLDQCIAHNNLQFDLVAANIIAEVLLDIMPDIKKISKMNGVIILSGIIKEREPLMIESLVSIGFSVSEVRTDGEWLAIAAQNTG